MSGERIDLSQDDLPKAWYNILPDLPESLPPHKDVESGKEIRRLPNTFTKTASELEFSEKRWNKIPEKVLEAYINIGRPLPLIRARRLEEFLKTPARIYYKCENLPPGGTFKTNASLPQAYWAMKEGYKRTVFGGTATTRTKLIHAFAARVFGLTPTIFMTRADCEQNRDQVIFLREMLGADLLESPSNRTETGSRLLKENPNHPGSSDIIGMEVEEETRQSEDGVSIISSDLNSNLLTQTVIGLEVKKQLELIDERPDVLVASVGSGSNFHGLTAPFMKERLTRLNDLKFLAVESETSAKLTKGEYKYVPLEWMPGLLVKAYELGWATHPLPITGIGIQTKYAAPLLSFLRHLGIVDTVVYPKDERFVFDTARIFLQTEGRLLAPESAYPIRAVMDEAIEAKRKGEEKVIVVCVSGTLYLDFDEKERYTSLAN